MRIYDRALRALERVGGPERGSWGVGELGSGAKLQWASRGARSASIFVEKSLRRQRQVRTGADARPEPTSTDIKS